MKKSIKAVLLSALIFPGAGHFYLKKTAVGFVFLSLCLVCLYLIITASVEIALDIANQIQSGEIPPEVENISTLVSARSASTDYAYLGYVWPALISIWLIAIADSYRVGRHQDKLA
jgi:hypothetical protein